MKPKKSPAKPRVARNRITKSAIAPTPPQTTTQRIAGWFDKKLGDLLAKLFKHQ